jgi:LuxR family maltose regulon positive regulatory protein
LFLDEGSRLTVLLKAALQQGISTGYVRRLLAGTGRPAAGPPAGNVLLEPLSERELDVLRLLGSDLDGPEIARRLSVSVNTVRTHTSHIYTKLGVNNRRAAVRRAAELELLTR